MNNYLSNDIYEAAKGLVMNCQVRILIVSILSSIKVFLINDIKFKTRDCPYTEVTDAQDITKIVLNVGSNFAYEMNSSKLLEKVQSINKEDFKFGTDDYIFLTNVSLNK